jgi:hypothetical protein
MPSLQGGAIRDWSYDRPVKDIDVFFTCPSDNEYEDLCANLVHNTDEQHIAEIQDRFYATKYKPGPNALQTPKVDLSSVQNQNQLLATLQITECTNNTGYEHASDFIDDIGSMTLDNDERLDLVRLQGINPIEFVEKHFDIGLCKGWFDGNVVTRSADMTRDYRNKTITTIGKLTDKQLQKMEHSHIPRIQQKYPDFKVIYKHERI